MIVNRESLVLIGAVREAPIAVLSIPRVFIAVVASDQGCTAKKTPMEMCKESFERPPITPVAWMYGKLERPNDGTPIRAA